jgi:hypothetical protein
MDDNGVGLKGCEWEHILKGLSDGFILVPGPFLLNCVKQEANGGGVFEDIY